MNEAPKMPATGGQAKVDEYVERITAGESKEDVFRELPEVFRAGVEERLNQAPGTEPDTATVDRYTAQPSVPLSEADSAELHLVRERLGMAPSEPHGVEHLSEPESITKFFSDLGPAFSEAAREKVMEYDARIRAAENGTPLRPNDTTEALRADFKQMTRTDWTPEFGQENSAEGTSAEVSVDSLRDSVNELWGEMRRRREPLSEMFVNYLYDQVPGEIGQRYDSHGIAKGMPTEQIDALVSLLSTGISSDKAFHTAPFTLTEEMRAAVGPAIGTSGGESYKDGLFVVVGGIDVPITEGGIKYVFVQDQFAELIPKLAQAFPAVEFHKATDAGSVLRQAAQV